MELTRFDLKNQAIQERIAAALERIATALEKLERTMGADLDTVVKEVAKRK